MKSLNNVKKSSVALLLASSPAFANSKIGGGLPTPTKPDEAQPSTSQQRVVPQKNPFAGKTDIKNQKFHISSITLDPVNRKKVRKCSMPSSVKRKISPRPKRVFSLAFDANRRQIVTLQFEMSNIPPNQNQEKRVVALLYSRCLSRKTQIKTPFSKQKLVLDNKDIEDMGFYNLYEEPTTGKTTSSQMTLEIDIDTNKLARQVKAGNEIFYFQAALLKESDYKAENYTTMILSPLTAVYATPGASCPTRKHFSDGVNNDACQQLPTKTN
ncbi:MAG: hypothetical protein DRQ49_15650 [Gammaproteobacteria bacterium]|nr:MAG: hypothetical protein DRQ41_13040 [Gammaproteobacteria bacterium]RKZ37755.1 MAG: hypothetical protein DRQ49_15650 [Gammaproteobacteria bacterium]RKZ74345.1 MAG: hypothetical protein DRQ57_11410 [Gammaproteobacteria bacterium]